MTPPVPSVPDPSGPPVRDRGSSLHESIRASAWTSRGVTKVVGGVVVDTAELEGVVAVGGDLSAGALSVRGSIDVAGQVAVRGEFSSRAAVRVTKGLRAGVASLSGTTRCDGPVEAEGRLTIRGTAQASRIGALEVHLAGGVHVPGEIRAGTAELELDEGSAIGSLVARTVRVVGPDGGKFDRMLGRYRQARIERIEADVVHLEKVDVGSVTALEVVLGRDCHVGRLESTKLTAHPTSRVGPESRSPPPAGLRR